MVPDRSEIEALLRELQLFADLDESHIGLIAKSFDIVSKKEGEKIFAQGGPGDSFYIIVRGRVEIFRRMGKEEKRLAFLSDGEFFGEEALLFRRPRSASVRASQPTELLRLNQAQFFTLIKRFPGIKANLERMVASRQFVRKKEFNWLGPDEVIIQVQRKHKIFLLLALILPLLVILLAFFGYSAVFSMPEGEIATKVLTVFVSIIMGGGIAWGIWNALDWSNDYYILTNFRVVCVEQVIFLYESRMEAPLNAVLAINATASFIGQIIGYGNINVKTFTGQVPLQRIDGPIQFSRLIEEFWQRTKRSYSRAEKEEMERSVAHMLHPEEAQETSVQVAEQAVQPIYKEPTFWQKYLTFKMRFEEGTTITYRRHWLILLQKSWKPALTLLILIGLMVVSVVLGAAGSPVSAYLSLLAILAGALIFPVFIWWFYHYVDWRNDIYQVTERNIFDIERKPLGTEVRKSASLDKILSLEHERPGFIGFLFNIGIVIINVGETRFDFTGVHEPARIQQDIFSRMNLLRQKTEKAEQAREQDRILALLSIYHRHVSNEPLSKTSPNSNLKLE